MHIFDFGTMIFGIELLIAQGLFLWAAPKRKYFWIRLVGSILLFLAMCYFYPMPEEFRYTPWFSVIRFLSLFFVSTLFAWFSFDITYSACLSLCGAGYAIQHISFQTAQAFRQTGWFSSFSSDYGNSVLVEMIIFPPVYALLGFLFARPSTKSRHYEKIDFRFDMVAVGILLICVGLSRLTRGNKDTIVVLSTSFYAITCCLAALIIQFYLTKAFELRQEKKVIQNLWDEDKKQYEISKENMELVNIKAHDLKHKLKAFDGRLPEEEISSMRKAIDDYDSHLKTGNDTLDVILNEKCILCRKDNITFTYLGDGSQLNRFEVMDLYSMLGNALDNAIEAVKKVNDQNKKTISMNIEERGDMVFISLRNYLVGSLLMVDGLPQTSKKEEKGFHGYGVKSIKQIAMKYGGDITISQNGDIFTLTIYISKS